MPFSREDNRVWFFTNERLAGFLNCLPGTAWFSGLPREIKKVYAIGGSGDFAFNVLSFLNLDEIILCDKKPMAEAAVEFKKELFEKLNFSEIKNLFLDCNNENIAKVCEIIGNAQAPQAIVPFEKMFRGACLALKSIGELRPASLASRRSGRQGGRAGVHSLVKILKKSKLFYNESFRYLKFIDEYLVYLQSEEKYEAMRSQLEKIKFIAGDFSEKLKIFPDNYFNLVYVSNILDSGDYNADNIDCLRTTKQKLTSGGMLLAVIQDKVDEQIGFIEQNGFAPVKKEAHKFNFVTSLKGHYYFSFALFRKEE